VILETSPSALVIKENSSVGRRTDPFERDEPSTITKAAEHQLGEMQMEDIDSNPAPLAPPPAPPPGHPRVRFGGISRRAALTVTTVGLLAGGIAGGYIVGQAATTTTTAATTTATASPSTGTGGAGNGKFVPNENATHEGGESAAREAQENAGQVPTVP